MPIENNNFRNNRFPIERHSTVSECLKLQGFTLLSMQIIKLIIY